MGHQEMVDRLIMLKAVRDAIDEAYEDLRNEYTSEELERTPMPKGDASPYGDVSGCFSKPTKDEVFVEFSVNDRDALLADPSEDFAEWLREKWFPENVGSAAEAYFHEVGEVLDGCSVDQRVVPGKPRTFKYMKVTPTKEARSDARKFLGPAFAGLLGGTE